MNAPQLPAYLQNSGLSDFTDRLGANLGTRAQPYLSIEGDRLTLVDANGDTEPVLTRDAKTGDPYLDCVIIDTGDHSSQIYYGHAYDPKAETYSPPACWSDNGMAPSTNCSEPQAKTCAPDPTGQNGCKWSVWGSGRAREGSKVVPPACSRYQKIALLVPGDDIQFLLRVPPNSLVQLANYNAKFKGHAFTMQDVTTRISIRDKTLFFSGLGFIDEATAGQRNAVLQAKKTDALVGRGDKPRGIGGLLNPTPAIAGPTNPAPTASLPASEHLSKNAPAGASTESRQQPDPLFAGNAGAVSTTPAPEPAPAATSNAPTRRRGRPPKEAAPETPATNGAAPQAPFPHGMANAPAPNADLEASLKSVFG